jgi:hypothetical protein
VIAKEIATLERTSTWDLVYGEPRMFTCIHHLGIMSVRVWFVTFVALFMVLSRLLRLGFSALPLSSQLVFSTSAHDLTLFVHMSRRGRTLLLYVDDMIITGDDPKYIALLKPVLVINFF